VTEPIDFQAEGLLDGTDGADRDARRELLELLVGEGATLAELKRAVAEDRLAFLPVERVLAGQGKYSANEISEKTGLDHEFQDRMFRSLGLALADPDERVYDDEDLKAAETVMVFLEAGFSEDTVLEVCRVLGDSMSRVAATFGGVVGETLAQPGDTERDLGLRYAETLRSLGPLAAPTLQQMLNLRLREEMRNTVISQAELQSGRLAGAQPITVGFVDIVGFTKLGEDVPPEDVGNVIRRFERAVAEAVEPPVRLVKTIGDAAMLVAPQPAPVVDVVVGLVERSREESPLLRGGVASGDGLPRAGDWYGHPVNLASRLTDFARRGSVVTSKEVRDAVGDGYAWSAAGSRRFKGVKGPVDVFRVRTPDGDGNSGGG